MTQHPPKPRLALTIGVTYGAVAGFVGGKVDGTITAAERVEVQGSSAVNGDIYTKSIVVLEGGRINGSVRMDESGRGGMIHKIEQKPMPVAVVR